ncbi:MAG: hypothetical protein U0792_01410 [Gemmataceae bacterium]
MANFFKYKSVADFEAENTRLGIDLRFSDNLARCFSRSRSVAARSGIAGAFTRWKAATANSTARQANSRSGAMCGSGPAGAKMIWGEACTVVDEGRANPGRSC